MNQSKNQLPRLPKFWRNDCLSQRERNALRKRVRDNQRRLMEQLREGNRQWEADKAQQAAA